MAHYYIRVFWFLPCSTAAHDKRSLSYTYVTTIKMMMLINLHVALAIEVFLKETNKATKYGAAW